MSSIAPKNNIKKRHCPQNTDFYFHFLEKLGYTKLQIVKKVHNYY